MGRREGERGGVERRGEGRRGKERREEIQSDSAGVTFSHNPPPNAARLGRRSSGGATGRRDGEAFPIIWRRRELKVVTFGLGGATFVFCGVVFFSPPLFFPTL